MANATLTSKGQVTIPKEVREDLGLEAGSTVMFVKLADGSYRLVARTRRTQELAGVLRREGTKVLTVEQMNEVVADAAAGDGVRGLRG